MKRISKWLVVLITIVSIFGLRIDKIQAVEGEIFSNGFLNYRVLSENGDVGTVELTGLRPGFLETSLNIPETVSNNNITYTVVSIADRAFLWKGFILTTVTIPDSVTTIGADAFGEVGLKNLVLGSGVTTIKSAAFAANEITSVVFGNNIKTIGEMAFFSNEITSLVIPDSLIEIEGSAFASNHISTLTIGNNITKIEDYAFIYNEISTVYLADKEQQSLFSINTFERSTTGKDGRLPTGIVEIYAPGVEAEYQDAAAITKNVGEIFELQVNTNIVYQQVARYDDSIDTYINPDENAATIPCDLPCAITMQWYRNDVAIDGATNDIYSEIAQVPGVHTYHVAVNDITLDDIEVTVPNVPKQQPGEEPVGKPVEKPSIPTTPSVVSDSKNTNISANTTTNTNTTVNTVDSTPMDVLVGSMIVSVGVLAYVCLTLKKKKY